MCLLVGGTIPLLALELVKEAARHPGRCAADALVPLVPLTVGKQGIKGMAGVPGSVGAARRPLSGKAEGHH